MVTTFLQEIVSNAQTQIVNYVIVLILHNVFTATQIIFYQMAVVFSAPTS